MSHLAAGEPMRSVVVHGVKLRTVEGAFEGVDVMGSVFYGCDMTPATAGRLQASGAMLFPRIEGLPFDPYRHRLYTPAYLFDRFHATDPQTYCDTFDARVYQHWLDSGQMNPSTMLEGLARRLHDYSISEACDDLVKEGDKRVVAVMGGHSLLRSAEPYAGVARLARSLTRAGFFMVSGGGPGAMEATHLGTWFADRDDADLEAAIRHLTIAPHYQDLDWLSKAFEVRDLYPPAGTRHESLSIPTWHYGHEPPNPFATHIAKYFDNSLREDGLVSVARYGIVFAPGSAGTLQEVFQDATQNHYQTLGESSPMVFFNKRFWTETFPVFPLLQELSTGRPYSELLMVTDEIDEAVEFIESTPPRPADSSGWSFCEAHGR